MSKKDPVAKFLDHIDDLENLNNTLMQIYTRLLADKVQEELDSGNASADAFVRAASSVINMTEMLHGTICVRAIVAMAEADELTKKETGSYTMGGDAIRHYTKCVEDDFVMNLRMNISAQCKRLGVPDILDPNAKLREELLN